MNALIFAAGLGTRLRPLTDHRPKALVEVNGRTLLEHTIMRLKQAGFDHLVVNVHHFADQIVSFLEAHQNFGIDIQVSDERNLLLDTGGGLRKALPLFASSEPVLIHNVDIVSQADLVGAMKQHRESSAQATLLINERSTSRYLLFDDAAPFQLRGWTNVSTGQLKGHQAPLKRAFSGIHIVNPQILPALDDFAARQGDAFPIMDFYLANVDSLQLCGLPLPAGCPWVDCGKPESLALASEILL